MGVAPSSPVIPQRWLHFYSDSDATYSDHTSMHYVYNIERSLLPELVSDLLFLIWFMSSEIAVSMVIMLPSIHRQTILLYAFKELITLVQPCTFMSGVGYF